MKVKMSVSHNRLAVIALAAILGLQSVYLLMMLLLLSYHRCLTMATGTPEPCMEGGRVNHTWCITAASHRYGGDRDGGGGWEAFG